LSSNPKAAQRLARGGKPNIIVIRGDDYGISNLSCHSMEPLGHHTLAMAEMPKTVRSDARQSGGNYL
jgi:arylsulfatase A-like enzyme